ncbi:Btn2p [Saccharomyces paradoxus]|uniref:Btn2p n=1 Tax=Saccharomyces paradoxus TaxID=27291 RepID=A0A8B8URR4_SACPA|nr:Btn2 [Saccharomyces paradoxus]QHS73448.1 Btn2 [Saccharomyces paradoxus]
MFSIFNSPCVFEQLPSSSQPVNSRYFDCSSPVSYYPECKRRKAVKANPRAPKKSDRNCFETLRYALAETPNGYTLSLYKQIPYELFSKYVNEKLSELKESHYRPTYHVVQDFFGNQYYVEDEADENALLRSAFEDLDFKAIGKKIAKDLFQDYEIELNHRGDELSILSKKDNIFKDFPLDQVFEDVFVIGCGVENIDDDSREKCALLKIGLVKHGREDVACDINKPKMTIKESPRDQSEGNIDMPESSSEEEAEEVKESLTKEEQIKKWIEEERLMQEESRKSEEEKLARENEERQKKGKQAKLKAKKESLMKKQKAKRVEQKKLQKFNSLTTSKIETSDNTGSTESDNESINSESDTILDSSVLSNTLKKHVSPLLEDIEDEEVDRYNWSLSRIPRGNSIIEDI